MIRQDVDEYKAVRGDTAGMIISEKWDYESRECVNKMKLFEILWPDSEIEKLYENEVEVIKNESR